jgi:putative DNA primase/helicase
VPLDFSVGDATCPVFDRVLAESLPIPADRDVLLDVLATALIPDARYEKALVVIGDAGTGKSTVVEAGIHPVFGRACTTVSMANICNQNKYFLGELEHSLINIGTEINTLEMEDSGPFKQLTSGERFMARRIYGKPFEMHATTKLVFLANSMPKFKYGTKAEIRRLRFSRFDNVPQKPDPTLKAKISAESAGVFIKLVLRARELLSGRPLPERSKTEQAVVNVFRTTHDPLGTFIDDCCVIDPHLYVTKFDLNSAFGRWCERNGQSTERLTQNWFYKNLYQGHPEIKDRRIKMEDGTRPRVICGLGLAVEDEEDGLLRYRSDRSSNTYVPC